MFTATPAAAPSIPAAIPSSDPGTADGGVGSLGLQFGLLDADLDDIKEQAAAAYAGDQRAKKPKVTHALFFDEEKGFKKMIKTFPKIQFQGKGKEVDDLKLLLKHYDKWFKNLHPHGDHFEDLVFKARNVLNEKEKDDDGISSDPKERLHMFRFQYKNSVDSLASLGEDASQATGSGGVVSNEARERIEANKKRAMELREKKRQGAGGSSGAAGIPEDDMEALWAEAEASGQAPRASFDDDDDPFGFGFDMGDGPGGGTPAAASKRPAAMDFEDEDPFGFGGGGFDDDDAAPTPRPEVESATNSAPMDPEVARRIAENREKAMARKRKREEAAGDGQSLPTTSEAAATVAQSSVSSVAATASSLATVKEKLQIEQPHEVEGNEQNLPFGFGGGLDDP